MSTFNWIQTQTEQLLDWVYAHIPQPVPSPRQLRSCRIVSHRGDHDQGRTRFENTLPAFDHSLQQGVWGIELDLRWTRDLRPVIHHDPHLERLYGDPARIADLTLGDLQERFPLIPTLEAVISRYGKKLHLILEVKKETYPDPAYQNEVLREHFASLIPGEDFHLLTLTPKIFKVVNFLPKRFMLFVAELNIRQLSRLSLKDHYGGVNGHFLLFTRTMLRRHQRRGQLAGTGFIASRNCLFREINRGVDMVFSNCAAELQAVCDGGGINPA